MSKYFHLPNSAIAKSKSTTVFSMVAIIFSLYFIFYILFLRSNLVDVTKDATISYRGESEYASVKVSNVKKNYNQRTQEFMDSVTYKVSPNTNLKNGDTITISASYDKNVAHSYHISPTNVTRQVKVEKLPIRFASANDIPKELITSVNKRGKAYLEKNIQSILNEDFTSFYIKAKPKLLDTKLVYRTFLDSKNGNTKDKIIDVFTLKAKGEVNTASLGEKLEVKEETIFYIITYNEINTSLSIMDENVYGEKLINASNSDISKVDNFKAYMEAKYGSGYILTYMNMEVEKSK
ncbi:MAG: hypothetical protein RR986_02195 [Longicatena sp.]